MAYEYEELQVPELEFDLENNKATGTRVIRVTPWESIDEALADLGGGAVATGNVLLITQPAKFPGRPHLWLHKIKIKPFYECVGTADGNTLPTDPSGAEFTLTYNTPSFSTNDDDRPDLPEVPAETYLTIDRNMSIEYVATDKQGLFWPAGLGGGEPFKVGDEFHGHELPIDTQVSSHIAIADIRITWHRVKNPPRRAWQALQGLVNAETFLDYGSEQVMFVGVQEQKQFQTDGTFSYSCTYQFNARVPKFKQTDYDDDLKKWLPEKIVRGGWNHFPRPGSLGNGVSPSWQKVYRARGSSAEPQEDADLLYPKGDFRLLFQPDPDSR